MFSFISYCVAKTQNPCVHDSRFEEFTVPSLDDFIGGNRDKRCYVPLGLRKYLSLTRRYCPGICNLFHSQEGEMDVPKHHFVLD